ncbi:hypothetical protein [Halosimplex salinum]|uniref:hypothetical protein n=1 Tax=Halosimplex salinum TaxID=1710538 RepID=UPI0013DDED14|nr:hypothetical protein [Halosimplex salinum]
MGDTDGDWTRRHARIAEDGGVDTAAADEGEKSGRVVRADPPADDWHARHAWCERS